MENKMKNDLQNKVEKTADDLANLHSCAFIETQDAGIAYPDGSFSVLGRMDRTQTRGCNLLVD